MTPKSIPLSALIGFGAGRACSLSNGMASINTSSWEVDDIN